MCILIVLYSFYILFLVVNYVYVEGYMHRSSSVWRPEEGVIDPEPEGASSCESSDVGDQLKASGRVASVLHYSAISPGL